MIECIVSSHKPEILEANIKRSKTTFNLFIISESNNVSAAYNVAGDIIKLRNEKVELCLYAHHDVFLPETFESYLQNALTLLEHENWGVLGVAGAAYDNGKKIEYGNILDRGRQWGSPNNLPHEVQTLDEMLLITRGDFEFDENLDLDFYGADICMQAIAQGRKNYAINAFCHHNSNRPFGGRTESFYRCQEYFKNKWKDYLPIATTCAIIET